MRRDVGGVPTYGDLDREKAEVDEVRVAAATVAAVRAMERAARRDRDLVDRAELDALHGRDG